MNYIMPIATLLLLAACGDKSAIRGPHERSRRRRAEQQARGFVLQQMGV